MLVKKEMLKYSKDVKSVRELEMGILDNFFLGKIKLVGGEVSTKVGRIKCVKLSEQNNKEEYMKTLECEQGETE